MISLSTYAFFLILFFFYFLLFSFFSTLSITVPCIDSSDYTHQVSIERTLNIANDIVSRRVLTEFSQRCNQHSWECKDPPMPALFSWPWSLPFWPWNKWVSRTHRGTFLCDCQVWWSYLHRFGRYHAEQQTDRQTDRHTTPVTTAPPRLASVWIMVSYRRVISCFHLLTVVKVYFSGPRRFFLKDKSRFERTGKQW